MPDVKKSYGIICFRPNKNGIQILMVKKSTTYHFCEFVAGHYKKSNDLHILKLFNNMTYHEKMDILSLKFQNMWYRIYKENPDNLYRQSSNQFSSNTQNFWGRLYLKKKSKFDLNFLHNNGEKLRKLIAKSGNVDTPWEFPKGRRDESKKENDIETAIREFYEETGIHDTQYKLLWHINPYVETYTDFGTTYQNIYYYADAIGEWEPELKFYDRQQISEISDVSWVSKNNLAYMKLEPITYKRLLNSFDKIITKYKNSKTKASTKLFYSREHYIELSKNGYATLQ
jgi:8-oxo-dGTP pyrophosphatase MutT (NUDIX family)